MIFFADGSFLSACFERGNVEGFFHVKYHNGDVLIGSMKKKVLSGLLFFFCKMKMTWHLFNYEDGKYEKTILVQEAENENG